MEPDRGGRCLCGATGYRFENAKINWQGICHCADCRRATGAPMVGWIGVRNGHWNWLGDDPGVFASSPGVERFFCKSCGAALAYRSDRWSHEIHFTAGTLDDPEAFAPAFHVYVEEALPSVRLSDGLPQHAKTADGN